MKRLTISISPIYGVTAEYPGQVTLRLSSGIFPVVTLISSMNRDGLFGYVTAWSTDGKEETHDKILQASLSPDEKKAVLACFLCPLDFKHTAMKVPAGTPHPSQRHSSTYSPPASSVCASPVSPL